jgi:hypothetical protein
LQVQDLPRSVAFWPDNKHLFVATDQWLNIFSWDGNRITPKSCQLLDGIWKNGRFTSDSQLQAALLGDTGNSLNLKTLNFNQSTDPPIQGDPKELLKKWKGRLGLIFDDEMRPVEQPDGS